MRIDEWKRKNDGVRQYAHFDCRVKLSDVWDLISNPQYVSSHGFYPFIRYTKKQIKYKRKQGLKTKDREINYAAHIDRCIFQLYAYKLNEHYNARVQENNISECVVAYRTDLGKSNIHFAKQAFDSIVANDECYIFVGDFTEFFDRLDHKYLKERIMSLLEVASLPEDYYAVYKNITRYSQWELTELLKSRNLPESPRGIREINKFSRVIPLERFKQDKRGHLITNKQSYGIPQGSPISPVLSNIYMLDFDRSVQSIVAAAGGVYMRYSDDFIIVAPVKESEFLDIYNALICTIDSIPLLRLQGDKSRVFKYSERHLKSVNSTFLKGVDNTKDELDYLGFTFDGKEVRIRDKTITKYNYRMRRKIKDVKRQVALGKKSQAAAAKKSLYARYSVNGMHEKNGNFLSYVERAVKIFDEDDSLRKGTKGHMGTIKRLLRGKDA